ncbi:hypothetical protein ACHAPU_007187 [Fusarium lateritium]
MDSFDISWSTNPIHGEGACDSRYYMTIHKLKESGESGCPKCMLIYEIIHQDCLEAHLPVISIALPAGILSVGFYSKSKPAPPPLLYRLFYLNGTPEPDWDFIKPGNLFLKDRRQEYQSLLTGWINNCNSNHKSCTDPDSVLPTRVLDVGTEETKRLFLHISSGEHASYVALSHCWGPDGIQVKTTKSTIKDYQREISFQELPKNFQDAVETTRSIGIRYLWIDSLCIVQDDTADWQIESSKMSSIYRDAYLVLAATQAADSSQGFLDRRYASTSSIQGQILSEIRVRDNPVRTGQIRNANLTVSRIYIQCLARSNNSRTEQRHHLTVSSSPLNRRAWVLQENILPRRIVHFTSHELLWECIDCLKCECMEVDQAPSRGDSQDLIRQGHFFRLYVKDSSNKLHTVWLSLLEEYHQLALSHESDRLPALSGLASLWCSRGAGTYLAGLWQDNILNSIMWTSPCYGSSIKPWQTYRGPSWSPFALGYVTHDQKPISAIFEFSTGAYGISQTYAKVVDAQCTPDGKDKMGAVKDGYLVLQTLVAEFYPDDDSMVSDSDWDRGIEDAGRQEVTLILIGYYEFSDTSAGPGELSPRAMITVPSKRVAGAYERVGILMSHTGHRAKMLNELFQRAGERIIKIV